MESSWVFGLGSVVLCGALIGIAFAQEHREAKKPVAPRRHSALSSDEARMEEIFRRAEEHFAKEKAEPAPLPSLPVYLSQSSRIVTDQQDALFKVVDAMVSCQTVNPKGLARDSTLIDPTVTRSSLTLRQRVPSVQGAPLAVRETTFTFKHQESGACYLFDPVFLPKSNQIIFKFGREDFETDFFCEVFVFDIASKTVRSLNDKNGDCGFTLEASPEYDALAAFYSKDGKMAPFRVFEGPLGSKPFLRTLPGDANQFHWIAGQGLIYNIGSTSQYKKSNGKVVRVPRRDTYLFQPQSGKSVLLRHDAYNATLSPNGCILAYITRRNPNRSDYEPDNQATLLRDLTTGRTATIGELAGYAPNLDTALWGDNSRLYFFQNVWGEGKWVGKIRLFPTRLHLYSVDITQRKPIEMGHIDFSTPWEGVSAFPITVSNQCLIYAIRSRASYQSPFTNLSARDLSVWSFDLTTKQNTLVWKDTGQFSWSFNVGPRNTAVRYVQ